jgi:hypothetical protein
LSRRKGRRLFGWHLDAETGLMSQVQPRIDGALWSPELNSWLKPDGKYLRLYNRLNRLRPTRGEVDEMKARREAERAEREALARQMETERAEQERRRAEQERQRADTLAEKLRALGIDPDQLL